MAQNSNEEAHRVKDYSVKLGWVVVKYGILWPIYFMLYPVTKLCLTGEQPLSGGYCGTGRIQEVQRRRQAKVRAELQPLPLYRKKDKKGTSRKEWVIDEKALNKRRRLSITKNSAVPGKPPEPLRTLKTWLRPRVDQKIIESGVRRRILDLPLEMRMLIWAAAVGNRTLHIFIGPPAIKQGFVFPLTATVFPVRVRRRKGVVTVPSRINCIECVHQPGLSDWVRSQQNPAACCRLCGVLCDDMGRCSGRILYTPPEKVSAVSPTSAMGEEEIVDAGTGWNPLPLLQTSRQIYNETLPVLYASNKFDFQIRYQCEDFPITLRPKCLEFITSIRVRVVDIPNTLRILAQCLTDFPNLDVAELDARHSCGFFRSETSVIEVAGGVLKRKSEDEKARKIVFGVGARSRCPTAEALMGQWENIQDLEVTTLTELEVQDSHTTARRLGRDSVMAVVNLCY